MNRKKEITRLEEVFRKNGRLKKFSAGHVIFQRDDSAEFLYYLVRGRVRAYLLYPDGIERTLCYVGEGNLVGEEAISMPAYRIVCADAATDIEMYAIKGSDLQNACRMDNDLYQELTNINLKKITLLCQWIFYAQFSHSAGKLAGFLYTNSEKNTVVRYTQEQIAQVTGMSRVSVSKAVRKMAKEGIVESRYGKIKILERERLREYCKNQVY